MAELDAEATASRKLDIGIAKLPYNLVDLPESYADTFRRAGARTAYTFRDKRLVPIMYRVKTNDDFTNHATQWERLHSSVVLGDGAGAAYPVVDDDGLIIGHYGEFLSEFFYSPGGGGDLAAQVDKGQVFVDRQPGKKYSNKATTREVIDMTLWIGRDRQHQHRGYKQYTGAVQTSISVIADPDGTVLQIVSNRSRDGITPVYYSPLDLIAIPRLFYLVGRAVARKVILALARRRANKAAARGAARELGSGTTEPPKLPIDGDPPVVRLGTMGAPGNLYARVEVSGDGIIYRVSMIVLRGKGDDAAVATARAAHREMIRRAAQQARKAGKDRFTMIGEQANQNFRKHADELAQKIGVPGSGKVFPKGAGAHPDYQVTLDVAKALK